MFDGKKQFFCIKLYPKVFSLTKKFPKKPEIWNFTIETKNWEKLEFEKLWKTWNFEKFLQVK